MTHSRNELRRHHLATCILERERLGAELEAHRAGSVTAGARTLEVEDIAVAQAEIARIEGEIAQLTEVIETCEREMGPKPETQDAD